MMPRKASLGRRALVPGLQNRDGEGRIRKRPRPTACCSRRPRSTWRRPRRLAEDLLDLVEHRGGPRQRRAVRQPDVDEEGAAILGRKKPVGRRHRRPRRSRRTRQRRGSTATIVSPDQRADRSAYSRCVSSISRARTRPAAPGAPLRRAQHVAQSAGLSVSALIEEITTAKAMVAANCSNRRPVSPGVKATGTNTASSTSVVATTGPVTSSIAFRVAVGGRRFRRPYGAGHFRPR